MICHECMLQLEIAVNYNITSGHHIWVLPIKKERYSGFLPQPPPPPLFQECVSDDIYIYRNTGATITLTNKKSCRKGNTLRHWRVSSRNQLNLLMPRILFIQSLLQILLNNNKKNKTKTTTNTHVKCSRCCKVIKYKTVWLSSVTCAIRLRKDNTTLPKLTYAAENNFACCISQKYSGTDQCQVSYLGEPERIYHIT